MWATKGNAMKQKISILLLTLISAASFAQINYVRLDQIGGVPMTITYNLEEESKIDGSRYFEDEWTEIKVVKRDGVNILIPEGKYDIYGDDIIVKKDGGAYRLDGKKEIVNFIMNDKTFEASTFINAGFIDFGFFEVMYAGENVILYKKKICLIQRGKPSNGIVAGTPDKFTLKEDFYVKKVVQNSDALKLKTGRKKILLKSNEYLELSNYLNKSKEGYESDEQVIAIFKRFDESL